MCKEEKATARWSFVWKRWWSVKLLPAFLLLSACGVTTSAIAPTIPLDNTVTAIKPTKVGLTATPISPSPRPSPSASLSPIATPTTSINIQCLEITDVLPSESKTEGVIVLDQHGYAAKTPYLLDLESGGRTDLPTGPGPAYFAVSPDKQWLAFQDSTSSTRYLKIVSSDGLPNQTITWEASWRSIAGWLDNERLLISREQSSGSDSLVLLNPFTNERTELFSDYPRIYNVYPGPPWEGFSRSATVYNLALGLVVYPKVNARDGTEGIVLWDINESKEIVFFPGAAGFGYTPKWSRDELEFVVNNTLTRQAVSEVTATDQELFSIRRDGQITQLTHLTEVYSEVLIGPYNSSPNGRYIAFWLDVEPSTYPDQYPNAEPEFPSARLAVLDRVTGEVTNYCVPAGLSNIAPIWSPNGQQILVENYYKLDSPIANQVYLVDLEQLIAIPIAQNATPAGWLTTIP